MTKEDKNVFHRIPVLRNLLEFDLAELIENERARSWRRIWIVIEIAAFVIAAAWLGARLLNLDVDKAPTGAEFHWVTQSMHFWTRVNECGTCAFWNGAIRGGFPALIDLQAPILHPISAISTWFLGVVNGAKITTVLAFLLAGLGQWWLSRVLGLGKVASLWGGLIAILGTHLAGRMQVAWYGVILATATASLIFPAAITLARKSHPKHIIVFGAVLALVILSGQGYTQIGLMFAAPAFLFLILDVDFNQIWRRFLKGGWLAVLLSAPFIIPLLHFWPNFIKPGDPSFSTIQPFEYFILNFVIRDHAFFVTDALNKPSSPVYVALYIGWVPIILAFLIPKFVEAKDKRTIWFLAVSAIIILVVGSGSPLPWLSKYIPFLSSLRGPLLIAPLAVPPLLGLSTYTLDKLFKLEWPAEFRFRNPVKANWITLSSKWLILFPLVWSLTSAGNFSRIYVSTYDVPDEVYEILEELKTPSLQWVTPPFGQWVFIETGIRMGLKLSPGILSYDWRDRTIPLPYFEAKRGRDLVIDGSVKKILQNATIHKFNDNREYAYITNRMGFTPCEAHGVGGFLGVKCEAEHDGWLILRENSWNGWYAWRDGQRVDLEDMDWLAVEAPKGEHVYRFRYIPWDVPLGLTLFVAGVIWSVILLSRKDEKLEGKHSKARSKP